MLSPAATSPVGCVVVGKAGPMPSAATDAVVYDGWEQVSQVSQYLQSESLSQ